MSRIELKDVWKSYKTVQALQGMGIETKEGELFCLLGPSGAGKTTTLRIIAGVETPDKGDILLDDKSITGLMPSDRDIALAFESYALYPQLSVFENLMFPLQAPGRKKDYTPEGMKERVREVAELLNISDLLDRLPRELSGGQRQRVGLGRVLVRKPKIYLLDEPISHLDAKLRHRMRGELKKIQSNLGITTIYSTPDQLEALSMADTIAVINHGKVEQVGSPEDVFERPANTFVARFVGDPPMNIMMASLENSQIIVDCDVKFQIPIPPTAPPSIYDQSRKGKVIIGIRPKDIKLVMGDSDTSQAKGQVKDVDTLGQTSVALVTIGALELKVKLNTDDAPARNIQVGVNVDSSKLHYFDAESKSRII
jgi:multiple sugar transport system ATP-binding protein